MPLSVTTGCRRMRPTPRTAHSGQLTIGVKAKGAEVRNRERPKLHLSSVQLTLSGAVDQIVSLSDNLFEREPGHVANYGRHQPGLGVNRNADVDFLHLENLVVLPAGIES